MSIHQFWPVHGPGNVVTRWAATLQILELIDATGTATGKGNADREARQTKSGSSYGECAAQRSN
jgi:hypothetical protein